MIADKLKNCICLGKVAYRLSVGLKSLYKERLVSLEFTIERDVNTVSRDHNRDALTYNRVVIKNEYISYWAMQVIVNHSRMWHFKIFGSFSHVKPASVTKRSTLLWLTPCGHSSDIALSNNYIILSELTHSNCSNLIRNFLPAQYFHRAPFNYFGHKVHKRVNFHYRS